MGGVAGICLGEDGNNLPSRTAVVQKFKDIGVRRVRTYHTFSDTLRAFANSGIELTVGITNEDFPTQLATVGSAIAWANTNIVPYGSSNIVTVTVGNEVLTTTSDSVKAQLLPSMQNLRQALNQLGKSSITVTTAHAFDVLTDTFPPSSGRFVDTSRMQPIVAWLSSTGSFFMANIYPYFAYVGAGGQITLQYGRLESGSVTDTGNGKIYTNLLAQQLDSVYAALARIGFGDLRVRIGEIGWPSAGGTAATVQNAQIHNQNVVNLVRGGTGTPVKPNLQIDAYIFAMFNENQKPAGIEQNWGLYNPAGFQPVYTINW